MNPLSRLIDPALLAPLLQAIAFAMAVSLLALVLVLALQKLVLERRHRAEVDAADGYARALANGTRVEALCVDPRRLSQRRALARVLRADGTKVATGQLRAAPWYVELVRRLQKDAMRTAWGERVAALEMLADLGAADLRPFLEEAADREKHPQAYAACLACLAEFAEQASALAALWNRLQAKPALSGSFNEGLFRIAIDALSRHGSPQTAADAVQRLLADANPSDPLALDVIRAVGKSGLASLVPELVPLCSGPQAPKSLRIACVRAVGMLQPDHSLLLNALTDHDWEVRASGAKYVRGTTPSIIAALSDCLTSPAFYVRYNAATTLAALGDEGRVALERTLTSCDAFAREISRYALHVLDGADPLRAPDSSNAPRFLERARA
jgi:HEAT repeats